MVAQEAGRSNEARSVAERLDNLRDVVAAWRFQLPESNPNAARLFAEIDDYLFLVTIAISGVPTEKDAHELEVAYANLKEEVMCEIGRIEEKEDPSAEKEQPATIEEDPPAAQGEPSATQLWAGHMRDTQDSDDAPLVEPKQMEDLSAEEEQPHDESEVEFLEESLNGMTMEEVNEYLDGTLEEGPDGMDGEDAEVDKDAEDEAANDNDGDTTEIAAKPKKKKTEKEKADGKGGNRKRRSRWPRARARPR